MSQFVLYENSRGVVVRRCGGIGDSDVRPRMLLSVCKYIFACVAIRRGDRFRNPSVSLPFQRKASFVPKPDFLVASEATQLYGS